MTITLKHEAQCRDCGAVLPAGTKARWFRNGDIYGNACHRWQVADLSEARRASLLEAVQDVLGTVRRAGRPQGIPEAAAARLVALKAACGQQVTPETYDFLIAELRSVRTEIEAK